MPDADYRINGELLSTSNVRDVAIDPHPVTHDYDRTLTEVNKGNTVSEDHGLSIGQIDLRLQIRGSGTSLTDELDFLHDEVTGQAWTLEVNSPTNAEPPSLWRDYDRLALTTDDIRQVPDRQYKQWDVVITATVLGAWESESGNYCQVRDGWFRQKSNGNYENQDGDEVTNFEITLPHQHFGYPKARRSSDGKLEQLTRKSKSDVTTRDGETRQEETYDLSGYLHPSDPSSTDDLGTWELLTCPSQPYLRQNVPPRATITSDTVVNADATMDKLMDATVTSASSVSAAADIFLYAATATATSDTSISASAMLRMIASATVQSDSSVSANIKIILYTARATVQSDSTVSAKALLTMMESATVQSGTTVSAKAVVFSIVLAVATVTSDTTVSAKAKVIPIELAVATVTSDTSISANIRKLESDSTLTSPVDLENFELGNLNDYSGDV